MSFRALAGRAFTTFLAGILIAAPVWGLRPMRALRALTFDSYEAGEGELVSLFDGLGGQAAKFGQDCPGLLLGDGGLFSEVGDDLSFGHRHGLNLLLKGKWV